MEATPSLSIPVAPEFVEQVAQRAVELLAEREVKVEPWIGVKLAAEHLDCPVGRIYSLAGTTPPRIPCHRDGKRLLFRLSELDDFVVNGGGKRP
jgi:hypothetical protein